MGKIIIERYIDTEVKFETQDNVAKIMTDIFEQSEIIGRPVSFMAIYNILPEELKEKITVTKANVHTFQTGDIVHSIAERFI